MAVRARATSYGVARPNFRTRKFIPPAVAATFAVWSEVNKSANVTISGDGLIATVTVLLNDNQSGRTDTPTNGSDKHYVEFVDVNQVDASSGFGIANASNSFTAGQWLGTKATSIGLYPDGSAYFNWETTGTTLLAPGTFPTWVEGDRMGFAVDRALTKMWSRVNGGTWGPSGDPALGTGGHDWSAQLGNVDVYISYNTYENDPQAGIISANFGTAFVDAIPSGFTGVPAL